MGWKLLSAGIGTTLSGLVDEQGISEIREAGYSQRERATAAIS